MDINYAEKIKRLRLQKNMTQKDLAKEICSQGLISKIEKNEVDSDIKILHKIAQKLNVTVGYLIGEVDDVGQNITSAIPKFQQKINTFIEEERYLALEHYFKEVVNDASFSPISSTYKLWIESIILANNYNLIEEAIANCEQAISILENKNRPELGDLELHINLLNSVADYYFSFENYNEAIDYFEKALKLVENKANFLHYQIKILFGLARSNSYLLKIMESNFYAENAVHLSAQTKDLQRIDSLYLLLADNAIIADDFTKAADFCNKAQLIAEIKENNFLIPYINRTYAKLQLKIKDPQKNNK